MAKKAADHVCSSQSSVNAAVSSLQQAMSSVEKSENKAVIQQAMNSLNSACSSLSNYKD